MKREIFLETERLYLMAPTVDDVKEQLQLQSDPEVMRYVGRGIRTQEEVTQILTAAIHHYEKHGFSLGNVYVKKSYQFIGRAGLIYLDLNDQQPEIELGYALLPAAWGQGYATELARACKDWGFQHLNFDMLYGVVRKENLASRKVLEKIGMQFVESSEYNGIPVLKYAIARN